MKTKRNLIGQAIVRSRTALILVLGGLAAALVLGGCDRNDAGVAARRESADVSDRPSPSPTESAAPAASALRPGAMAPSTPALAQKSERSTAPAGSVVASPAGRGANAETSRPNSASADGRTTSSFPRPEDVPLAPMGHAIGFSPVTQSPGYYPGDDPEADAVRTGRRHAPLIDVPFKGGMKSPEDLALFILDALRKRDSRALQGVRVTSAEFSEIMWPEFPQSRPACNSTAEFAYSYMDRTSVQGASLGLSNWGGSDLRLEGITYPGGRSPYANFTLYNDVELHVRNAEGQPGVIRFVRCLAERKGVWKVYTYKDKE
jgi:hypothetical protein